MTGRHKFTVSRSDGEPVGGEYAWMGADGPDDWSQVEDEAEYHDGPVEYQIEEWVCVGRWTKLLPERSPDEDDEPDYDPSLTVRTVTLGEYPT